MNWHRDDLQREKKTCKNVKGDVLGTFQEL